MEMVTFYLTISVETVDGNLHITGEIDDFGCIRAYMTINSSNWEEVFVDPEEFEEFLTGLPILKLNEITEYQMRSADLATL